MVDALVIKTLQAYYNKYGSWAKAVLATNGFDLTKLPSDGIVGLFKSCDFGIHHNQDMKVRVIGHPELPAMCV